MGGDFNAGVIDWETGLVPDDSPNRLLKEKLTEVISEAGPQQMQREPTRGQNLLDLFCCNKPPLVKSHISIPGISDHSIVLADCDLKATINKKPPRKGYQWSKADWQLMNYRSVSMICITCKLFEHIICKHILANLEDHKILTDLQHGFRSGRSCETQLVTTFQDLAQMHNKKAVKLTLPF